MTDWYAPNQQAVRADGSGPAEEGDGGSVETPPDGGGEVPVDPLDAMTKDQLLEVAAGMGLAVTASNTKAEIRAAIDAANAG